MRGTPETKPEDIVNTVCLVMFVAVILASQL